MIGGEGILKRTYDTVALFVVVNVVGATVLLAYLISAGVLSGEKVRTIGMVLRGESVVADPDDKTTGGDEPAPVNVARATALAATVDNADPQTQMEIELLQREAERVRVELDQRLELINSILLKVQTERKAFKRERETAAQVEKAEQDKRRDKGFEKQVAIFESLAPKIAVQHLLGMNDPDEAAKILIALETDKAKRIVEAARRGADLAKMRGILRRLRDVAPGRSAALEDEKP